MRHALIVPTDDLRLATYDLRLVARPVLTLQAQSATLETAVALAVR